MNSEWDNRNNGRERTKILSEDNKNNLIVGFVCHSHCYNHFGGFYGITRQIQKTTRKFISEGYEHIPVIREEKEIYHIMSWVKITGEK